MLQLTLPGLLPSGCLIAFNRDLGTLILLAMDGNETGLLNEQQFMPSEVCVLVPLMSVYPYFCPHELLLASFNNVRDDASDGMIERYRASLLEVFETPVWDAGDASRQKRPLPRPAKLHPLDLDIVSILETG